MIFYQVRYEHSDRRKLLIACGDFSCEAWKVTSRSFRCSSFPNRRIHGDPSIWFVGTRQIRYEHSAPKTTKSEPDLPYGRRVRILYFSTAVNSAPMAGSAVQNLNRASRERRNRNNMSFCLMGSPSKGTGIFCTKCAFHTFPFALDQIIYVQAAHSPQM